MVSSALVDFLLYPSNTAFICSPAIRNPSPKMKWRMARSFSTKSTLIAFHHPCVVSGLMMKSRRRLLSSPVIHQKPLSSCSSWVGSWVCTGSVYAPQKVAIVGMTVALRLTNGGKVVSSIRGSRLSRSSISSTSREGKKVERATFCARCCFHSDDELKGRLLDKTMYNCVLFT